MTPTAIVAYLVLFATVGFVFVLASLLLGKFLRAWVPTEQKLETYECGEPAVGPASVQFDLRFYVVALVFLIFEVEVAMFFPPATVFGKMAALRDPAIEKAVRFNRSDRPTYALSPVARKTFEELGVPDPQPPLSLGNWGPGGDRLRQNDKMIESQCRTLALDAIIDLVLFFAVLMVGFAYVWRRGDLDWVRATRHPAIPGESAATTMRLRSEVYR